LQEFLDFQPTVRIASADERESDESIAERKHQVLHQTARRTPAFCDVISAVREPIKQNCDNMAMKSAAMLPEIK
jgi:hypothetical protein